MSHKKKLFVQKGQQSGSRSPVRVLIWATAALVVILVATPLILRQKNDKEGVRPPAERGKVVKNIPKAAGPPPGSSAQPTGMNDEYPRGPASVPGALPDAGTVARTGDVAQTGPAAARPPDADEGVPGKPGTAAPPEPARPAVPPSSAPQPQREPAQEPVSVRESSPSVPTGPAAPAGAPPAGSGQQMASVGSNAKALKKMWPQAPGTAPDASRAKKPAPAGKGKYAVQVGSFKDKKNADEMQRNLQKKGYQTDVKVTQHPTLGQLYVVSLKPVDSLSKANTQMEQIKNEEKVKPMLIESR